MTGKENLATVQVVHPGQVGAGKFFQCVTYLICGPAGAVLIDPGTPVAQEGVLAGIAQAGVAWDSIRGILLTHCHVDHSLGAYRLRGSHCPLITSSGTADILRIGGHQVWYEYPQYVIPTPVDRTVADGEIVDLCGVPIRVIYTPGHTNESISFMVETTEGRAVITGDLLCHNGHPGFAGSDTFSEADTFASIEKLMALEPQKAYWGHGVIEGPAMDWLRRGLELGRAGQWRIGKDFHPEICPPPCLKRRDEL